MIANECDFVRYEKFKLLHEVSRMLRDAPSPVHRAWREGWTDIEFFPILRGWYGKHLIRVTIGDATVIFSSYHSICGENGEHPYYEPEGPHNKNQKRMLM